MSKCGCVIELKDGSRVTCEQEDSVGKDACYLHAKYFEGLTAPARSTDIDLIEGGGIYNRDSDVECITNKHGKTIRY